MRSLNILLTYESVHAACEVMSDHVVCVESEPAPPTSQGWNKLVPGVRDTGGFLDLVAEASSNWQLKLPALKALEIRLTISVEEHINL